MEDSQIIELYWQKNADSISETSSKYGAYCYTIADNILHSIEDSEECVNDTWLHAWNAMPPQKPNVLRMFLAKITRSLSVNRFKARNAEKCGGSEINLVLDELADCLASPWTVEEELEEQELVRLIEDFLETLSPENRTLLMHRYWFSDSYGEIVARTGLSEKNVSVRLPRIRKQLRHYFEERGVVQ